MISKEELQEYFENSDKLLRDFEDLCKEFRSYLTKHELLLCWIFLSMHFKTTRISRTKSSFNDTITNYSRSEIERTATSPYGWKEDISEYLIERRRLSLDEDFMEQFRKDPRNISQWFESAFKMFGFTDEYIEELRELYVDEKSNS